MGRYFVFFVAQKMNYFRSVVREMVPKVVTCTQSSNTSYSPHKINFEFVLNIFLLLKKKGTNWSSLDWSRWCNVKIATREMECCSANAANGLVTTIFWICWQRFLSSLAPFKAKLWHKGKLRRGKPVKSVKWSKVFLRFY